MSCKVMQNVIIIQINQSKNKFYPDNSIILVLKRWFGLSLVVKIKRCTLYIEYTLNLLYVYLSLFCSQTYMWPAPR